MGTLLVASIDFGTTFSGWAFSFKHEFERDPGKVYAKQWTGSQIVSLKAPTCALIRPCGAVLEHFGYEAESRYSDLALEKLHGDWFYFKRFKMMLFNKMDLHRDTEIEDAMGKKLPARIVFSLCIKYLKDDAMKTINTRLTGDEIRENDIRWVLTVPAIWNDAAKQFMREAAEEAKIDGRNLLIALEPESASLYCHHLPSEVSAGSVSTFQPGTKYMILDAGGGTVDITVHQVAHNGGLVELHKASGGAWGGTKVDEAYEKFLEEITGNNGVMTRFKEDNMENYVDLMRDFEVKKREINPTAQCNFRLPSSLIEMIRDLTKKPLKDLIATSRYKDKLTILGDKLRLAGELATSLFDLPIQSIIAHVTSLLEKPNVTDCHIIVMVGGFSEAAILQSRVKEAFPHVKVITPSDAGVAVLKGAVIFGHNPGAIAQRVLKLSYGQEATHPFTEDCLKKHPKADRERDDNGIVRCFNVVDIHARAGQAVTEGQLQSEQVYTPLYDDQHEMESAVLTSPLEDPQYVTDCTEIGKWTFPIKDAGKKGKEREFGVSFMFGGTEVKVKIVDKATGEIKELRLNCLG
ncbi:heat shock 70 kDa protein 12A-like isoform X2 [Dreissena polymorpha]|uniref:Heat shock 70 kDa protein 12A n=2 Tax=Dreissena polymorpha TaxID=45954 RepID=A0A9D4DFR4_DREPO|nr:heat shock 70 kDa protein 12A-like isoform X2 [Dreissena polymorpha]XP_052236218.1 heat shock 70 kDa protein 12A-like isoform X2 [Dreissena polymorpha]XP_052236219.1 heat shock 70 kDa protein 12A-like isoform X2 [Dreissena polymorpha]KAH3747262.1 hypothetical protein DPMN_181685 [Dreissena polymorpha]